MVMVLYVFCYVLCVVVCARGGWFVGVRHWYWTVTLESSCNSVIT
jgi:hypothetical protein